MKGFRNTIDIWRERRDLEEWKDEKGAWKDILGHWIFEINLKDEYFDYLVRREGDKNEPILSFVLVDTLIYDLEDLMAMMEEDNPAKVSDSHIKTSGVICGFSHAYDRGLRSMTQKGNSSEVQIRIGVCAGVEEEEESFDWRK